jgi:trk system potassium uptake protein TrkA
LAKSVGAHKVVSLIEKFDYLPLVPRVGLDAAVSPRMSAVNAILRYVRRGRVMTVATLKGIEAEAIEFRVGDDSLIANRLVAELSFPAGAVIGTIIRGDAIIIPRGMDRVLAGDEVIVFALPGALPEVEKFFG